MAPPLVAIKKENAAAIASNDFCMVTSIGGGGSPQECQRANYLSRVLAPHRVSIYRIRGRGQYNCAAIASSQCWPSARIRQSCAEEKRAIQAGDPNSLGNATRRPRDARRPQRRSRGAY